MPKHYLIFIHGIGELKDKTGEPGQKDFSGLGYKTLWQLLIKQSGLRQNEFEQQFGRIETVWHTEKLQRAEQALSQSCFPSLNPVLWRPMDRLRNFMTCFIGDVAAYVSEDVNVIRRSVWESLCDYRDPAEADKSLMQLLEEGATYSIVAHSLGTVIAYDYLCDLFHPTHPQLFVPLPDKDKRPEDAHLENQAHDPADVTPQQLQLLKDRFRHFFSMGSPIALFLMRKGSLWADMKQPPFLKAFNPVREAGRIWCNFWNSDDPIAYPVASLFGHNPNNGVCKLLDVPVETRWIFSAHVDYWKNHTVAQTIMDWITHPMGMDGVNRSDESGN